MRFDAIILAALSLAAAAASLGAEADRPNFVVFIADDVSWNDFGCYGNEAARTPNIDRLAANGVKFTNVFLTASSCSPSRCSIITGRYPHNNGEASELHRPLPSHLIKFPALLKHAGYYTALAGKDHMPQVGGDEDAVWDVKKGASVPGNSGGHGHWVDVVQGRPKDRPFFFWFAAIDAHRGWEADRQWNEEKYGPKHDPADVIVPPFMADTPPTRRDLASYYNEVTRFDWHIGQVVDELKKQNASENTLIIVMADNGRPFPRAKTRLHDSGMKTPFVVHWPQGIETPNATCESLISAIDICPTILDLAGVKIPEQVQGMSFARLFENPKTGFREYAFSEHNWHDYEAHGRAVRDDEGWLYIRNARPEKAWLGPADSVGSPSHTELLKLRSDNALTPAQADVLREPRPAEELYHTPKDPLQVENLIGSPTHADKLAELRRVMNQWQDVTGDSVPERFSPDYFDRETGYIDSKTGEPIRNKERVLGDPPGFDRNSAHINEPGPR